MLLQEFCKFLEEIHSANDLASKSDLLQTVFEKLRNNEVVMSQQYSDVLYQGIRLILPKMDHRRKSYNMKETKIVRILIKMLNLPDGFEKGNLLKYHEKCSNTKQKIDFAQIVHSLLRKYIFNVKPTITVTELNIYLDSIANRMSEAALDELMLNMFNKLTPMESKWTIRIMLKDLKLGIDNNRILSIFHKDAVDLYKSNINLKKVCETLWNVSVKLNDVSINLYEPFQPMLSKRCDASSFSKDFPENKLFYVENKFDGERFQLHMNLRKFKYFSRNGFDYSNKFGEFYTGGILTPRLEGVFKEHLRNVILDGEMMLWNTKTQEFGSKGMTVDVKKLNNLGHYQPCFCVFDVLLLNDVILATKELSQRLKILKTIFHKTIKGTIIISHYDECFSRSSIVTLLNNSTDKEEEGIVVKDPKSIYRFGDRTGGWYKLKMEYFESFNDLDVVLMGGNFKANSVEVNSFHVGICAENGSILCLGRVASGLNFEEKELVNKTLKEKGMKYEHFISHSKGTLTFGTDSPDVWIEPENSLVFTIRATELTRCRNSAYQTPYTLRFPRILRVRNDKPYKDCLSISELLQLCQQNKSVIKLNTGHLELDDFIRVKTKQKDQTIRVNVESMEKVSNCFTALKFYVLNGTESLTINDIEVLIGKYCGQITLNEKQEDIHIVLAGKENNEVEKFLKYDNKYDLIRFSWFERVAQSGSLLKYRQEEVLSVGLSFYNCLADDTDAYGDSYKQEVMKDYLKHRMELMSRKQFKSNLNYSVRFGVHLSQFNRCLAYFDKHKVINDSTSDVIYDSFLDEIEFKCRKGKINEKLVKETSLIVVGLCTEERRSLLKNFCTSKDFSAQLIDNIHIYKKEKSATKID